mmetsp:Transcript_32392/g.74587  ORF Transcript_32392/g.74587 Transcript_32392/m.74587 type:complete len:677 (-) Transcript_32392:519-2549(-)
MLKRSRATATGSENKTSEIVYKGNISRCSSETKQQVDKNIKKDEADDGDDEGCISASEGTSPPSLSSHSFSSSKRLKMSSEIMKNIDVKEVSSLKTHDEGNSNNPSSNISSENDDDDPHADDAFSEGSGPSSEVTGAEGSLEISPKYAPGQKVYAKDNDGCLYLAIIRQSTIVSPNAALDMIIGKKPPIESLEPHSFAYFVHYQGWNVRWDKWIHESELIDDTEENQRLAKDLRRANSKAGREKAKRAAMEAEKARKKASVADTSVSVKKTASSTNEVKKNTKKFSNYFSKDRIEDPKEAHLRRRGITSSSSFVSSLASTPALRAAAERMVLPFSLKKVLVDEWERIVANTGNADGSGRPGRIVADVPAQVTVRKVLKDFLESKRVQLLGEDDGDNKSKDDENSMQEHDKKKKGQDGENDEDKSKDDKKSMLEQEKKKKGEEEETTKINVSRKNKIAAIEKRKTDKELNGTKMTKKTKSAEKENELSEESTTNTSDSTAPTKKVLTKEERTMRDTQFQRWSNIISDLASYFDSCLPIYLLYRNERPHHLYIMWQQENKPMGTKILQEDALAHRRPSDLYGAEYLLRLFVRLPLLCGLIVEQDREQGIERGEPVVSESEFEELSHRVAEIIRFLQRRQVEFFRQKYRPPREEELTDAEVKFREKMKRKNIRGGKKMK